MVKKNWLIVCINLVIYFIFWLLSVLRSKSKNLRVKSTLFNNVYKVVNIVHNLVNLVNMCPDKKKKNNLK